MNGSKDPMCMAQHVCYFQLFARNLGIPLVGDRSILALLTFSVNWVSGPEWPKSWTNPFEIPVPKLWQDWCVLGALTSNPSMFLKPSITTFAPFWCVFLPLNACTKQQLEQPFYTIILYVYQHKYCPQQRIHTRHLNLICIFLYQEYCSFLLFFQEALLDACICITSNTIYNFNKQSRWNTCADQE